MKVFAYLAILSSSTLAIRLSNNSSFSLMEKRQDWGYPSYCGNTYSWGSDDFTMVCSWSYNASEPLSSFTATSFGDCGTQCYRNYLCRHFSYTRDGSQTCYIYQDESNYGVTDTGFDSGWMSCLGCTGDGPGGNAGGR